MSSFTKPLDLRFLDAPLEARPFMLLDGFDYHVDGYPSQDIVHVPKGFCTDFASVPRAFWPLVSPISRHGKAAVVHDFLYWLRDRPRKEVDLIFLEAMLVLGVPKPLARTMYRAVRTFGPHWNQTPKAIPVNED